MEIGKVPYGSIRGCKYVWRYRTPNEGVIREIARRHNLSMPVAHTLYARDFVSADQINSFLFMSKEKNVANSCLLKGAVAAVERLESAIKSKEKILVFGDYDVDGVTSTSLFLVALIPLGADVNYYLPHREREGYGLSVAVVEKAAKHGFSLIVTVDNGIAAHKAARRARELGIDLIITDHHRPHTELPEAFSIIDPNQEGCEYPYKKLAGVGVIFKIVSLLYELRGITLPDKVYELLMLGTVADVVPLTEENRFWVQHGLYKVNKRKSFAMAVLGANSNLSKSRWGSLDIGFMIAPQINALGRLNDSRDAVKFLISSNKRDVEQIGRLLKEMNDERKNVERRIYDEIEALVVNRTIDVETENVIVAASAHWPSGVIGLVAGRLMQNYGKPTFLFHENKDGTMRGSCRSIPEFDMFAALHENRDLLLSFGGHSFAAGLCLKKEHMHELKHRLEEKIARELPPEVLQPRVELDAYCELSDMTMNLVRDLERLEPFGNSNRQPSFIVRNVTLLKAPMILKDKHVKCSIFSDGIIKPVIFFNRSDLFAYLNTVGEKSFTVAGHVVKNEWNDRISVEIQGLDVAN